MILKYNRSSDNTYGMGTQRLPKEFINIKAGALAHTYRESAWKMWNSFLKYNDPRWEQMVFYYLFFIAGYCGLEQLDLFFEKLWITQLPDEFNDGTS